MFKSNTECNKKGSYVYYFDQSIKEFLLPPPFIYF